MLMILYFMYLLNLQNDLQRMCSDNSTTKQTSKQELENDQEETILDLLPYFTYKISVSVVNEAGKGNEASQTQQTLEEGTLSSVAFNFSLFRLPSSRKP